MQHMPYLIRTRNGGRSFELRIKHRLLKSPFYATFSTREEAERVAARGLAELDKGQIPIWMQRTERKEAVTIAKAIQAYRAIQSVRPATGALLDTIVQEIGAQLLSTVNYDWAEAWIKAMKGKALAPGTIRKKKSALSRVFQWVTGTRPHWLSSNPLALLPHGYSGYDDHTIEELAEQGKDVPVDVERNRRIDPDEEQRIVERLRTKRDAAKTLEERAEAEGLCLMFQLALRTAMRMREIYTLTIDQISLEQRSIFLGRTKNGDRRVVPLNTEARALLQASWPALEQVRKDGRLLPFWDGSLDPKVLAKTSSDLSRRFRRVFAEAGSTDLHFHDTRHEAVCRWVLTAPVPLTTEQLARAAGMRNSRTRERYLSLRGSELADFLG
ncbi:MAG TPA: site-specific integrase [Gammaproteobacteria bacterium]